MTLPDGGYALSGTSSLTGVEVGARIKRANGDNEWFTVDSYLHTRTFNIATGDIIVSFYVLVRAGQTADNVTVYPMLNVGSTALPYEPYNGSITQLPIPRPLHKVGDVRDVCRTRVKSVYDKRIVLDGSDAFEREVYTLKGHVIYRLLVKDIARKIGAIVSDRFRVVSVNELNYKVPFVRNFSYNYFNLEIFVPGYESVEEYDAYLSAHPLTVYYQSTAYNGTNGLDVCLTEYQTGFVELDGTEPWVWNTSNPYIFMTAFASNHKLGVAPACSHYQGAPGDVPKVSQVIINSNGTIAIKDPSWQSAEDAKAYLAAQKAAGTPVQVAYQLATPEVYATDPVDFDNASGPLTVMTGGELEVRMTELIGTRSDVSNNTVAFSEAAQDADISSGEKLTVLFGKIKKRFAVIASNLSNIYNKTESDERYATAAQGEKADNALPKTGGIISGNLTVVQDLTVQRAFNGMRIKAGTKTITTPTTNARAELFNSDTLNELFGTTGVAYTNANCVVIASNGDYDFHPRVVTSGYVNSKWAVFTADAGNFTSGTMRVNYIAIKFA